MSRVVSVRDEDLAEISTWSTKRGLPDWPGREWLSDLGFWVPGAAAAWLVTTNSPRAFIEDTIANPSVPDRERGEALFAVERVIAQEARRLGFRYLLGVTKIQSVRDRVRIAGYHVTEAIYSLHSKDLTR